jgi:pimeloyl-ACP methyl ester carboxylesterase
MQPDEVTALGELAGDAVSGLASHIRELHEGIATRVWNSVGPTAAPVRVAHDRIASGIYGAVGRSLGGATRAGARALSARTASDAPSLERARAARIAVGALNGVFGDRMVQTGNRLAWPMALRSQGAQVELEREALARAYRNASGRLVVFLHGLCETEEAWQLYNRRCTPYGTRLEAELGYTPLYFRYNTGRHISENGRELARLMATLVEHWPVEVQEIALVGHSMGGLLARSATHYGAGSDWTKKVRHVFSLGSPHRGAPLEVAAFAACAALRKLPETRPFANALNNRSAGIKDLGRGYLVDEDWREHDPEAFLQRTGHEIPFLESANHYFVAATLTRDPDARMGRAFGDLLVLRASAWAHGGKGEKLRFPVEQYSHIGGANHFELLNHPAIYEQIRRWLTSRPPLPAAAAA